MEPERDKRNVILAGNLSTFGRYLRTRRVIRVCLSLLAIAAWSAAFWFNWPSGEWAARAGIALFLVLALSFGISATIDWLLRQEQKHAEQSLEICRSGFIADLGSNSPPELKIAALAIGDAIWIANDSKVEFAERELRRDLWSICFVVVTVIALVAVWVWSAVPRHGLAHNSRFSDVEWLVGLCAIAAAYVVSQPRVRLELRAFEDAERSWFLAIANALEQLKKSSITVGKDVKDIVQVRADSPLPQGDASSLRLVANNSPQPEAQCELSIDS